MAAQLVSVAYPQQILTLPVFHNISKSKAEAIVYKCSTGPGVYLLRPSSGGDVNYLSITLSVSNARDIRHLRVNIEYLPDGKYRFYFVPSLKFSRFMEFLRFYSKNALDFPEENIFVMLERGLGNISYKDMRHPSNKNLTGRRNNFNKTGRRYSEPESISGQGTRDTTHASSRPQAQNRRTSDNAISRSRSSSLNCQMSAALQALQVSQTSDQHYKNSAIISQHALQDPRNWLPAPLPVPVDFDPTYTPTYYEVDPNRDFFQETYEAMKEAEVCECGLGVADSTLPQGWTVHKCDHNIFFQIGEETVWELSREIIPLVTIKQAKFIHSVCEDVGCAPPGWVKAKLKLAQEQRTSFEGSLDSESTNQAFSLRNSSGSESTTTSTTFRLSMTSVTSDIEESGPYEQPAPLFLSSARQVPPTSRLPTLSENGGDQQDNLDTGSPPERGQGQRQRDGLELCHQAERMSSRTHQQDETHYREGGGGGGIVSASNSIPDCVQRRTSFHSIPAVTVPTISGAPVSNIERQ